MSKKTIYQSELHKNLVQSIESLFTRISDFSTSAEFQCPFSQEIKDKFGDDFIKFKKVKDLIEKPGEKGVNIYVDPRRFDEIKAFFKSPDWNDLKNDLSAKSLIENIDKFIKELQEKKPIIMATSKIDGHESNLYSIFISNVQLMKSELSSGNPICSSSIEIARHLNEISSIFKKAGLQEEMNTSLESFKNVIRTVDVCNGMQKNIEQIEYNVLFYYQLSVSIFRKAQKK